MDQQKEEVDKFTIGTLDPILQDSLSPSEWIYKNIVQMA